jgi:chromosome segregation ATPase
MTIENVYSYLEYLTLTVDQLADAVIEREEETAVYETQLSEMNARLQNYQAELNKAEARAQLAEVRAQKAEEKIEELSLMLKSAKQTKKGSDSQADLFAAPSAPAPQPLPTKSNKVANDENALILAKKLDSTIDKVQKLIREARA